MKNKKFAVLAGAALLVLAACDGTYTGNSATRFFESAMRGTWETNTPPEFQPGYNGTLVIARDTVTITGYEGYIYGANEAARPFSGFTKGAALPGYPEKTATLDTPPDHTGLLHVKDAGVWQPGIAYSFYHTGSYPYQYFLRLTFGGREETLRKASE
jgi:hypothetical protein